MPDSPRYPANPDAPKFTPGAWNDGPVVKLFGSNCFQYAFAGSNSDGSNKVYDEAPPIPGETKGQWQADPVRDAAALTNAMNIDGLRVVGKNLPPNKPGFYVLGVYLAPGEDFHFVRQDANGGWSGKPNIGEKVVQHIPPATDGGYQPLPEELPTVPGYRFMGYAYAPREGVHLGIEDYVIQSLRRQPDGAGIADYLRHADDWHVAKLGHALLQYDVTIAQEYEAAKLHYAPKPLAPDKTPPR